jgi:hypothetical protein
MEIQSKKPHYPNWKQKKDFSFIITKKEEDIYALAKVILETNLKQLWQMKTHCCTCHGKFWFFFFLVQIWLFKKICAKFHQNFNIKKNEKKTLVSTIGTLLVDTNVKATNPNYGSWLNKCNILSFCSNF